MNIYLVTQYVESDEQHHWSGIFDSLDKAIGACRDRDYCVTRFTMNEQAPHEEIHGVHYFPVDNYTAIGGEYVDGMDKSFKEPK